MCSYTHPVCRRRLRVVRRSAAAAVTVTATTTTTTCVSDGVARRCAARRVLYCCYSYRGGVLLARKKKVNKILENKKKRTRWRRILYYTMVIGVRRDWRAESGLSRIYRATIMGPSDVGASVWVYMCIRYYDVTCVLCARGSRCESTVTRRRCGGVALPVVDRRGAEPGDRARTSDFVLKRSRAGRSSRARYIAMHRGTAYTTTIRRCV